MKTTMLYTVVQCMWRHTSITTEHVLGLDFDVHKRHYNFPKISMGKYGSHRNHHFYIVPGLTKQAGSMKTKVRTLFRTLFFDCLDGIAQRTIISLSKIRKPRGLDSKM